MSKVVHIIGRGCSWHKFNLNDWRPGHEVWTINFVQFLLPAFVELKGREDKEKFRVTRAYWMDNVRAIPEEFLDYINVGINKNKTQVVTSRNYGVEKLTEFPIGELIEKIGITWANSTFAYMMISAILEEATDVHLWGTDFGQERRAYRKEIECITFWSGYLLGRGIRLHNHTDLFLQELKEPWEHQYGYDIWRWRDGNLHDLNAKGLPEDIHPDEAIFINEVFNAVV